MLGRPVLLKVIVLAFISTACRSIPYPRLKGDTYRVWKKESGKRWKKKTVSVTEDETAKQYCKRLAGTTDRTSQRELGWGIVGGILTGAAIIAGTAMGPDKSEDANWAEENRNTLVVGAGGLLSVPTTVLLMRSRDASQASKAVSEAYGLSEEEQMQACLRARADLTGARGSAAEFVRARNAERIKQARKNTNSDGGTSTSGGSEGDDTSSPDDADSSDSGDSTTG